MGVLDFLNKTFGEKTDLPIQVDQQNGEYTLYVEEKRAPDQPSSHLPYQGLSRAPSSFSSRDSMEDDGD